MILISFAGCSLLVYRNAVDFRMLIWCHEALLNSCTISVRFLVYFLGFSSYRVMLSAKKDSLLFSNLFTLFKIYFLQFSGLARNSSIKLNKSGESKHHCLFLSLGGKNSVFLHSLGLMLAVSFSYMPCEVEKFFFSL